MEHIQKLRLGTKEDNSDEEKNVEKEINTFLDTELKTVDPIQGIIDLSEVNKE